MRRKLEQPQRRVGQQPNHLDDVERHEHRRDHRTVEHRDHVTVDQRDHDTEEHPDQTASRSTTTPTPQSGSRTTLPKGSAGQSLVEWANCMRSHGDPDQADPTIDPHGGINIYISSNSPSIANEVHNGTAPCNAYLAAAAAALRAGARDLTPPDQDALVRYSRCMRANGVPNFPDLGTGETTNLNGIDTNSPFFVRANNVCGRRSTHRRGGSSGAGPPGDISVQSGPNCGASVCTPGPNRPRRARRARPVPATTG